MQDESMQYDVLIVGAGPAGLSAAIKIKQLCQANNTDLSVCILEKGSEVGAHILSGAVLEPRALNELLPDWQNLSAPITCQVTGDEFNYLTEQKSKRLLLPAPMCNRGNYIVSLSQVCRWLGRQAENLGVEIYPGFAGSEILFNDNNQVIGVKTGDMGIEKNGEPGPNFQAGMAIHGKQIILAEGCRGSLSQFIIKHFDLDKNSDPQTYGIGLKELWQVDPSVHKEGKVLHSIGWPLDKKTYGGSFIYFMEDNKVSVGFVVGLDYQNPYLDPFEEFQRFKTHPSIKPIFENGERISYGARAINEGGLQSLPKITFPGGVLVGDAAGFLNVPKIKGAHCAMKSGMLAAEAAYAALSGSNSSDSISELTQYTERFKHSWLHQELKSVRNIRPSFHKGLWPGLIYSAIDTYLFCGHAPWTLKNHADHLTLKSASESIHIEYPKPYGKITFDKLSSVYLTGTHHEENQPCHLKLTDAETPIQTNLLMYDAPEQRYCPAGVYEIIDTQPSQTPKLQINAQNCIHCKTCDIKDPEQNITWVPPQGGEGPNYSEM